MMMSETNKSNDINDLHESEARGEDIGLKLEQLVKELVHGARCRCGELHRIAPSNCIETRRLVIVDADELEECFARLYEIGSERLADEYRKGYDHGEASASQFEKDSKQPNK